jgi:hypothetical protein
MRKLMLALMLVVAMTMVIGSSALAAPAEKATVTRQDLNFDDCYYNVCFQATGTIYDTRTPSGNESFTFNVMLCAEVYQNDYIVAQGCLTAKGHGLTKNEMLQQLNAKGVLTLNWGENYSCTIRYAAQYANGEVRFVRLSLSGACGA